MCLRALVLGLSRNLQRFAEVAVGFVHTTLIAQGDRDFRDDRAETCIVLLQELPLDTQRILQVRNRPLRLTHATIRSPDRLEQACAHLAAAG